MYAMSFSQVGANIQRTLSARGLSQQNLADKLGISKQVMSKIINGNKAINVTELSRIASILNSTTDELLTVNSEVVASEPSLAFMGMITDPKTREKVDLLRTAIDQIHLLEELVNE